MFSFRCSPEVWVHHLQQTEQSIALYCLFMETYSLKVVETFIDQHALLTKLAVLKLRVGL